MSFDSLGLLAEIRRAISEKGYTEATPIQRQAIPVIMEGRDILAGAQTGTGKTAGFTLPLLHRLHSQPRDGRKSVRALILTPTRELAAQVEESVRVYGKYLPLKSTVVFGGVGFNPQVDALRRGIDILVATPGRLLDHISQKTVDLSKVEILVLDEADRMLDMGFIRDIRKILALLPKQRQNLLFSATFADEIKELADTLLHNPALIEVARRNASAELVTQVVHPVDRERKRELLSHLISSNQWEQVLVFTRTKHGANRLAEQLAKDGITSAAIHGNKSQGARTRALSEFKQGIVRVLVATDIAARGLDIDQLPHVVNFELPNVPEDYVHRIGRTGRAGNTGEAMSLVCVDERDLLKDIERLLKKEVPKTMIAGFEPNAAIKAEPIPNGRNSRGARPPRRDAQGSRDAGRRERPEGRNNGSRGNPPPRAHKSQSRPGSGSPARSHGARTQGHREPRAAEPNGNRAAPSPRANGNKPHAPKHAQPQRQHGNSSHDSKREVPALFGGGKRNG